MALLTPEADVKLISLCFGNCDTQNSLQNILTLFNVLQLEDKHHKEKGTISKSVTLHSKPIISVGMSTALNGTQMDATDFHGSDGLGNVHKTAPQFTASKEWIDLFSPSSTTSSTEQDLPFIPSKKPSYLDILDVLREEEEDSVVIVAIGPLMNIAKANEVDPVTFSRVKHVVAMGGALRHPGNVTPFAEFNIFSDYDAAKHVFDLTGRQHLIENESHKQFKFTLLPLDLTEKECLYHKDFADMLEKKPPSPLVEWTGVWISKTFDTFHSIAGYDLKTEEEKEKDPLCIHMHDPLAVWYAISAFSDKSSQVYSDDWKVDTDLDIRVETKGELTQGMTVADYRSRPKRKEPVHNDRGKWLSLDYGNLVNVVVESPYTSDAGSFGRKLLHAIYGKY